MRHRRRFLIALAATQAVIFVSVCLDVAFQGPLSMRLDTATNDAVLKMQSHGVPVGDIGAILSLPGAGPVDVPIVAVAAGLLLWWRRWGLAATVVASPILGAQFVDIMKSAFHRDFPPCEVQFTTPAGAAASAVHNPEPFVGPAYAFPSGHTLGAVLSVALAATLVVGALLDSHPTWPRRRWWAWTAASCLVIVLATGLARVLLTVHWLTDVMASWALGGAAIATALAFVAGQSAPLDASRPAPPVRVLGFTGMPGSGKSEAMEVAKGRGIPVVRMGDLIWEEVERRGLPRDAKHVPEVANEMRQTHGKDIWSKRTVERVRELARGKPIVIIDGVRSDAEVQTFRNELGGDFVLVAVHTDRHHRFERMLARGRADDPTDEAVLQARDVREIGWGMAQCIALADEMIVNDGTLETFREKVARMLDRLAAA